MTTFPRTLIAVVAAAGLMLVAAGCGSDDSSGQELSKDDFIAQADAICAAADAQLTAEADSLFGGSEEPPPAEEQEAFVTDVVAPSLEQQLNDIRELTPPASDADQVDEILAALEGLVNEAKDNPSALLTADSDAGQEASELADDYGLVVCGG